MTGTAITVGAALLLTFASADTRGQLVVCNRLNCAALATPSNCAPLPFSGISSVDNNTPYVARFYADAGCATPIVTVSPGAHAYRMPDVAAYQAH
jgi:hypothetical protein